MNTLIFETENKYQTEKLLLINLLGIIESLTLNLITLEEAERVLFTPFSIEILQGKQMSKEIINIIHLGTELEDVLSIIPDKYNESLLEMRRLTTECLKLKQKYLILNKALKK